MKIIFVGIIIESIFAMSLVLNENRVRFVYNADAILVSGRDAIDIAVREDNKLYVSRHDDGNAIPVMNSMMAKDIKNHIGVGNNLAAVGTDCSVKYHSSTNANHAGDYPLSNIFSDSVCSILSLEVYI